MLNGISQFCQNYYDQIPAHSLKTIGLSAVTSFTVSTLVLSSIKKPQALDLSRPFLIAGIAAVAATVHALTIPIFNYIFDNNGVYNPYQEFAQIVFSMTLTHILFNRITSLNINLLTRPEPSLNNFEFLTSSLIRIATEIAFRILFHLVPPHVIGVARSQLQSFGINFSQTTPIYFACDTPFLYNVNSNFN